MYKLLSILLFAYGLAVTTADIYDNSYALIIGIDKYENVQNLNYAVKDAESIQDILINTFDFPDGNVTLLKNEDATKQSIIEAFSDITTKAEDNDRVLIYFAGHGETMDLPDGGEMGYLLPVDGNNENLYVSSIGMDELKKISLMSKAKHLLYLIDACYGGIATIGSRGLDSKTTPNYIEKITKNKSRQIITAGGRGEQVIEKSEWGHSAFTLNLNRGLKEGNADMNSDGYITANELGLFLSQKVTIDSENQQTPQYGRMTSQEGEFVFVYSENTAVIQDKSTDAKLDLLLSEIDTLKSQESSDDGTIFDRARFSNWRKRYAYNESAPEVYGIGLSFYVENNKLTNHISIMSSFTGTWRGSFVYSYGNKDLLNENITSTELLPISKHDITIGLHNSFFGIAENLWFEAGIGISYSTISWQNVENNTSDNYIKTTPVLYSGIGSRPLASLAPTLIVRLDFIGLLSPHSYNETDGIIKLDDWQIQFSPGFTIALVIPKYVFFPK